MAERLVCFDTNIYIKYLTPDEQEEAATRLVLTALQGKALIVAPSWARAEVGSVLRKKVRARLLRQDEADVLWTAFLNLPIDFVDLPALWTRAWEIAARYELPTLYDAAFLACTEVVGLPTGVVREFWTADHELLRQLRVSTPTYVRELGQ